MSTEFETNLVETRAQGLALLREGRIEEGLAVLRSISSRLPSALGDLAYAHFARGDNDSAATCLNEYLQKIPDDPGGWGLMGKIACTRLEFDQAEKYARQAVRLQPKDARLWFDLGEIFLHARKWKDAAHAYRRCLRFDPHFAEARVRLVTVSRIVNRERIRAVTWWRPVSAILRRIVRSRLVGELIETNLGIALDDARWRMPLEWGEAADFAASCPAGQEPDQFDAHFAQCRCAFWQWFCSQQLDGPVSKVLEVGVGPGHVAHHFARRGLRVLSVTPSELARRERQRRGIEAVRGDPHFICEKGGSFDLVVASHTLEHSRSPLFAIWEWKRLLRPDGYLMVMAHCPSGFRISDCGLWNGAPAAPPVIFDFRLPIADSGESGGVLRFTYWQLRWMFRQAGFHLIAETLGDSSAQRLDSVDHVDGRRPAEPPPSDGPSRGPWRAFFLLRRPGRLPYDGSLEKPRIPASS